MRKILFIVTQGNFGGAQKYVFDLALALAPACQVTIASGHAGILARKAADAAIPYRELSHLKRKVRPWHDVMAIFEIARLVKKLRPDVVHVNSSKAAVVGSLGAYLGGCKKIVATMHGLVLTEPMPAIKKALYWLAEKLASPFADKVIAVSAADRKAILKYRLKSADAIATIYNGLKFDELEFLAREQAKSKLQSLVAADLTDKKIVGAISDAYPVKGLDYLAQAAFDLKASGAVFVVFGQPGPAGRSLNAKIEELNLQNSFFLVSYPKAASLLKALDAFVLPSLKEGLPYALLEAAAAGRPIVATAVGGIPEVIQNEISGLLVEPKNSQQLVNSISRLLDNPKLAADLGAAANETVKKFDFATMLAKTKEVYES